MCLHVSLQCISPIHCAQFILSSLCFHYPSSRHFHNTVITEHNIIVLCFVKHFLHFTPPPFRRDKHFDSGPYCQSLLTVTVTVTVTTLNVCHNWFQLFFPFSCSGFLEMPSHAGLSFFLALALFWACPLSFTNPNHFFITATGNNSNPVA